MPRKADARLEGRILDAAYRIWSERGENALTMRAVARAARTTTPMSASLSVIPPLIRIDYFTKVSTKRRMRTMAWRSSPSSVAKHTRTNPLVSLPNAPPSSTDTRSVLYSSHMKS